MISSTITGTVMPLITPSQLRNFLTDANGYMTELSRIQSSPAYSEAVIDHIAARAEERREFTDNVVAVSTWYEPPKVGKGQHIDAYA